MTSRYGDWIQTYSGKAVWPLDPRPEEICIEDIAHSLALTCRYAGHTKEFYSVAQHSVLVARLVQVKLKLQALLHDASEAYLQDLVRPLKRSEGFGPAYRKHEAVMSAVIAEKFGVEAVLAPEVKQADDCLLVTEMRDLMVAPPMPWKECHVRPLAGKIDPWTPKQAEEIFLLTFRHVAELHKIFATL